MIFVIILVLRSAVKLRCLASTSNTAFSSSNFQNLCVFNLLQAWPDDALEMVANKFLQEVDMEDEIRESAVRMCKSFHESVRAQSER